ncbi:MAG TPA: hypothetical protein PKA00_12175, partial [Saprospiraceae bacterium]|nr:hypothetical protein [Saprospiraceae bacterium]HMQ83663.1 hypothetical protein [Saprospiraceae bacterium]
SFSSSLLSTSFQKRMQRYGATYFCASVFAKFFLLLAAAKIQKLLFNELRGELVFSHGLNGQLNFEK